jgi:lysophospholipase L1-like esterase
VTSYTQMVALGSSFAAGPGVEPLADRKAARSARNYAHLVAEVLGADLVDATVSGATTKTILEQPQRLGLRKFAPQIESLHPNADLVTVTAGGNDLGYIGGMLGRAILNVLSRRRLIGPITSRVRTARPLVDVPPERSEAATAGLVSIVEAVRRTAPEARCILVDYLPVITEHTVPGDGVPFDTVEIAHFRRVADVLAGVYREAGDRSGAEVLHSAEYDITHGAGSDDPWVFGLRPFRELGSSFHPTPAGMRAVADLLIGLLSAPPAAGS